MATYYQNLSFVLPGHSRPKDGVASLAYDPGIHEASRRTQPYRQHSWTLIMDCRVMPGKDEQGAWRGTGRLLQVM